MLVPDEIRKCVVFAAFEQGNGRELCGTVFLVGLPVSEGRTARFAVTAAHVLDKARERSLDGNLYLRFNRRGGGLGWVETRLIDWLRHPTDDNVDCATISLTLPEDADHLKYPLPSASSVLTPYAIDMLGFGVGDEVFFPGLFTRHAGTTSNVPIVRTGTIAAMLTTGVEGGRGSMEAYLIEARSIGGLSGSPVFIQIPPAQSWRPTNETLATGQRRPRRIVPRFLFMGLIHGHWDVRPVPDTAADAMSDEVVNMGIAIVVPAVRVMEVLSQPAVSDLLEGAREEDRARDHAGLEWTQ